MSHQLLINKKVDVLTHLPAKSISNTVHTLRPYQLNVWSKRGSKFMIRVAPTGAGKSLEISACDYDFLERHPDGFVMVFPPQLSILESFNSEPFYHPETNKVCSMAFHQVKNLKRWIELPVKSKDYRAIKLTQQKLIRFVLGKYTQKTFIDFIKKHPIFFVMDEFHHLLMQILAMDISEKDKRDYLNQMGNVIRIIYENMQPDSELWFFSASPFRHDRG